MSGTRERLYPIGIIRSILKERREAPKQGREGAPDAWLEVRPSLAEGLDGIAVGDEIIVVTWLHRARRDVLSLHPRGDKWLPLTGVFATRSPDRPNPLGLHPVIVKKIIRNRLRIGPVEAIDRTPVVDIKPLLRSQAVQTSRSRVIERYRGVGRRAVTFAPRRQSRR